MLEVILAWLDDVSKQILMFFPRMCQFPRRILRAHSLSDAARMLQRTEVAVRIRRRKLGLAVGRHLQPQLLRLDEAKQRIEVPKCDSKEQEERVRFVGGPYAPPLVPIGGMLKCELRGDLQVAGYSNALIPWPVAASNHPKQLICLRRFDSRSQDGIGRGGEISLWNLSLIDLGVSTAVGHRTIKPRQPAAVLADGGPGAFRRGEGEDVPMARGPQGHDDARGSRAVAGNSETPQNRGLETADG